MSIAADRLRKARESWVECGEVAYLIRRPTALQYMEWRTVPLSERIEHLVVGWRGITNEMVGGSGGKPAEFDSDLMAEFLCDRTEDLTAVWAAVEAAVVARISQTEEVEKKSG